MEIGNLAFDVQKVVEKLKSNCRYVGNSVVFEEYKSRDTIGHCTSTPHFVDIGKLVRKVFGGGHLISAV